MVLGGNQGNNGGKLDQANHCLSSTTKSAKDKKKWNGNYSLEEIWKAWLSIVIHRTCLDPDSNTVKTNKNKQKKRTFIVSGKYGKWLEDIW